MYLNSVNIIHIKCINLFVLIMTNCLNSIKTYVPWIIDVNYYHYQYISLALCIHYYIILTPNILYINPLTNTFTISKKSQRIAAFEIATMASTNDDNKFIIVAEGGLVGVPGMW